jgi:hypothetical protein
MTDQPLELDDLSEAFDEDAVEGDDRPVDDSDFDELPDVFDATQTTGDAIDLTDLDEAAFDESLVDEDDDIDDEDLDDEVEDADAYAETDLDDETAVAARNGLNPRGVDEAELTYVADVDNHADASSGVARLEAAGPDDEDGEEEDDGDDDPDGDEEEEEDEDDGDVAELHAEPPEPRSFKPARVRAKRAAPHEPVLVEPCHDHLAHRLVEGVSRQEALIDEAVEETFPASDPISPKHIS